MPVGSAAARHQGFLRLNLIREPNRGSEPARAGNLTSFRQPRQVPLIARSARTPGSSRRGGAEIGLIPRFDNCQPADPVGAGWNNGAPIAGTRDRLYPPKPLCAVALHPLRG